MKTLQYFTEGLLNKDNKTKAMSMVDVFLEDCIEGDPLSVWDAFKNTGICKTSRRLTYDGYTLVRMGADSKEISIKIPIENSTFYNCETPTHKNIIVFELIIRKAQISTYIYLTNYIPHDSYDPRDKEMLVPIKESIEMMRTLLESDKFKIKPMSNSMEGLIRKINKTNICDDHDNIIMDVKISNIAKRWLEKNGFTKWA